MGLKYFTNYSRKDYNNQSQNWCILQDKRGVIYVANHGGLMEFDGISWREIPVPNKSVRSLAMDGDGKIYIGGIDEIGYLENDIHGRVYYVSLLKQVDKNYRNFSNVWQTHSTKEGIFFRTSKYLFLWNRKQIKIWKFDTHFRAAYSCKGKYFVQLEQIGLMFMKNGYLELIPGGERFAVEKVHMMNYYDTRKILLGTRLNGLFIYNGETIIPFSTEVDNYLKKNELYHGTRLSSGDFALATQRGGLVVIDSNGNLKHIFNKDSGLQDDNVQYVFEDYQANLWLAMGKGISKIEYASPISIYDDDHSNLSGIILSVTRHGLHDNLYAGTDRGLYYIDFSSENKFRAVHGIDSFCWFLLSVGDKLLVATSVGLFQVENNSKRMIINNPSYFLLPSRQIRNRIWAGTRQGLISLYLKNDQWLKETIIKNITEEIQTIAEDEKGNLWLGTLTKGVLRVTFPDNGSIDNQVVTRYGASYGLPPGEIRVFPAANHIMFATENGIFLFDEKKKAFFPDYTLGIEFAGGENGRGVFRIVEDKRKRIWIHSKCMILLAIPDTNNIYRIEEKSFLRIPMAQVNFMYPDPWFNDDVTWFAGVDGLLRYANHVKKNYNLPFKTLIRQVSVNGEPVFYGYQPDKNKDTGLLIIPYRNRNIRFRFAAPFFEAENQTQFQCLLDGYDKQQTTWNTETLKDYTNLDSGLYTFRVRAKNVYGITSSEAIFHFKVLPPWFKTWWALLLCSVTAGLFILLLVKWRSWKLIQEKQKLEKIIKESTREIKEKNVQLLEQSKKLEEMDRVKSRFFANISHEFRTPLTLIMGPLEQMLNSPDGEAKAQKRKMKLMLRNSQRLLGLINQLLELSKYDSGAIKLQASRQNIVPFLKGILYSFDSLALQKDIELIFQSEAEFVWLYFDTGKLEEVISNLLSNAAKFTPAGGRITLTVKTRKAQPEANGQVFLEISVSDTGPGIPREELALIFDRFYQAGSTYEYHQKGIGIGLAIAREIIELHHGTITAHSPGDENRGSIFIIQLPMGEIHLKPEDKVDPSSVSKKLEFPTLDLIEDDEDELESEENVKEIAEEPFTQEKCIVLVVEDNPDVREYIRGALEPDYIVKEARDGKEGLREAREMSPDLIICDIMMPGMDGYELCRILKTEIATSHIPIIMLTAKAAEENIIKGLETGADDYITKPFNTKMLLARLRNLIELRRQLQQTWEREMTMQPTRMRVPEADKTFMKELKQIMEENIANTEFNVDLLCQKLYMSHATLYRKINALTGESPTDFIRSYRLKRGLELLKSGMGTVLEVALEVGFSSANYFSKCFKKKFHQLPTEYQLSEKER